jgi:hypothetical protein
MSNRLFSAILRSSIRLQFEQLLFLADCIVFCRLKLNWELTPELKQMKHNMKILNSETFLNIAFIRSQSRHMVVPCKTQNIRVTCYLYTT